MSSTIINLPIYTSKKDEERANAIIGVIRRLCRIVGKLKVLRVDVDFEEDEWSKLRYVLTVNTAGDEEEKVEVAFSNRGGWHIRWLSLPFNPEYHRSDPARDLRSDWDFQTGKLVPVVQGLLRKVSKIRTDRAKSLESEAKHLNALADSIGIRGKNAA